MAFFKTSSAPIIGLYQNSGRFTKKSSLYDEIAENQDNSVKKSINLISKEVLGAVAKIYNISDNIDDYIFPVVRTVTANKHNGNGDLFTHGELSRFSQENRCQVYQTFKNDPLHVEHAASDPKTARGWLPDVAYITGNESDMHVIAVVAVDTKKDPELAGCMLSGTANKFSMGCICDAVQCSECGGTWYTESDVCDCLRYNKMTLGKNGIVHNACLGVSFKELSNVGEPADETAITQAILQYTARKNELRSVARKATIEQLLPAKDQIEVARFFSANFNKLPDSMIRLSKILF